MPRMDTKRRALALLKKARKLITPLKQWCQGVYARDVSGNSRSPMSKAAVSFCAIGALEHFNAGAATTNKAIHHLGEFAPGHFITQLNDTVHPRAHQRTLKMFDEAIKSLEKELRK